jgi:hypothetical protein
MAISVTCTHCKQAVNVSDDTAGQSLACPQCKGTLEPPDLSPRPANAAPPNQPIAASSPLPTNLGKTCPECRFEVPFLKMMGVVHRGGTLVCPHCKANLIYPDIMLLRIVNRVLRYAAPIPLVATFVCLGSFFGSRLLIFVCCIIGAVFGALLAEIGNIVLLRNCYRLASLKDLSSRPYSARNKKSDKEPGTK